MSIADSRKNWLRRAPFILVLLALIAALVLILVLRRPTDTAPATGAEAVDRLTGLSSTETNASPGLAAPSPSVPIPPIDTPISIAVDALRQHADAGDAQAACRLGMELLRCQHVPEDSIYLIQESERQEKYRRENGEPKMAERIAAGRRAALEIHAACREIPKTTRDRAHNYIRQAALAGEPEAMLRYASGETLGLLGHFHRLNSPEFEAWRREAPVFLRRALAAGRPEAVYLLAEAYRPTDDATTTIIGWLVANDPIQAHAYALLQRQLSGGITPPGQRPINGLDDAGIARAKALADDLRQRHFAGVTVDPERVVLGLPPLTDTYGYSKHAAVAERFCQSDGAGDAP